MKSISQKNNSYKTPCKSSLLGTWIKKIVKLFPIIYIPIAAEMQITSDKGPSPPYSNLT